MEKENAAFVLKKDSLGYLEEEVEDCRKRGVPFVFYIFEPENREAETLDIIRHSVRSTDIIIKLNGKRYLLFIKNIRGAVCTSILKRLKGALRASGIDLSIGYGIYPDDGDKLEEILRKAQERMVSIKKAILGELLDSMPGKSHILELLEKRLSLLLQGEAFLFIVEGRMGMGKSYLLESLKTVLTQFLPLHARYRNYDDVYPASFLRILYENPILKDLDREIYRFVEKGKSSYGELEFLSIFENSIEQLSKRIPVVFLLDDFDRLDQKSLSYLSLLIREHSNQRIGWICTVNPDAKIESFLENIGSSLPVYREVIEPVERDNYEELLGITGGRLDETIKDFLSKETNGIPLFLREIYHNVEKKPQVIDVPPLFREYTFSPRTLEYVKLILSRLEEDVRAYISIAATYGREFEKKDIEKIAEKRIENPDGALDMLIKKGWIVPGEKGLYAFSPPSMRDLIYSGLDEALRIEFHREILNSSMATSKLGDLAYHARGSGAYDKAIVFFKRAAEESLERGDKSNALLYLEEAYKLIDKVDIKEKRILRFIYLKLGELYLYLNPQKSIEYSERALKCSLTGEEKAELYWQLGVAYTEVGDWNKARKSLKLAREEYELLGDNLGVGKVLRAMGNLYLSCGNSIEEAEKYFFKAMALITEELTFKGKSYELQIELARLYESLGIFFYIERRDLKKARFYFEKALKISEEMGVRENISSALYNLSVVSIKESKLEEALNYLLKSFEIAKNDNLLKNAIHSGQVLLKVMRFLGDYEGGYSLYRKVLHLAYRANEKELILRTHINALPILGALLRMSDISSALGWLEDAENMKPSIGKDYLKTLALLRYEFGDMEGAMEALIKASELMDKESSPTSEAFLEALKGAIYYHIDPGEAIGYLVKAKKLSLGKDHLLYLWASVYEALLREDDFETLDELLDELKSRKLFDFYIPALRMKGERMLERDSVGYSILEQALLEAEKRNHWLEYFKTGRILQASNRLKDLKLWFDLKESLENIKKVGFLRSDGILTVDSVK